MRYVNLLDVSRRRTFFADAPCITSSNRSARAGFSPIRDHRTPERILGWIDAEFGGTWSSEAAAGGIWVAEDAARADRLLPRTIRTGFIFRMAAQLGATRFGWRFRTDRGRGTCARGTGIGTVLAHAAMYLASRARVSAGVDSRGQRGSRSDFTSECADARISVENVRSLDGARSRMRGRSCSHPVTARISRRSFARRRPPARVAARCRGARCRIVTMRSCCERASSNLPIACDGRRCGNAGTKNRARRIRRARARGGCRVRTGTRAVARMDARALPATFVARFPESAQRASGIFAARSAFGRRRHDAGFFARFPAFRGAHSRSTMRSRRDRGGSARRCTGSASPSIAAACWHGRRSRSSSGEVARRTRRTRLHALERDRACARRSGATVLGAPVNVNSRATSSNGGATMQTLRRLGVVTLAIASPRPCVRVPPLHPYECRAVRHGPQSSMRVTDLRITIAYALRSTRRRAAFAR